MVLGIGMTKMMIWGFDDLTSLTSVNARFASATVEMQWRCDVVKKGEEYTIRVTGSFSSKTL